MESQNPVLSPIGEVVAVATPSSRKLRALGLLWTGIGITTFVLLNYLIFQWLLTPNPILTTSHPVALGSALLVPLVCWYALGSAVQRFHAAAFTDKYFRAGPAGISVCVPDDQSNTFLFSFRTLTFDLRWEQIRTWYPFIQSMNGVPTERSMIFETVDGKKLKVKTYNFAESEKQIAANITHARSLTHLNTNGDVACESSVVLPPGVGDVAIEIKKKKEPIKELDLATVHISQRADSLDRIADVLQNKHTSICPVAAGFKYKRKHYRPFQEWKHVSGLRIHVRRGLLDGFEIQLEPKDSELRQVSISMCHSSLIGDIRRYVSIAVGALFVILSLSRFRDIASWLGDFSRLAPVVVLLLLCAVVGLSVASLELPIRLLRLGMLDRSQAEVRQKTIKVGIQEIVV